MNKHVNGREVRFGKYFANGNGTGGSHFRELNWLSGEKLRGIY